jgi:phage shock protein E
MPSDLSVQELITAIKSEDASWKNPLWLDVRTTEEVLEGTIPGSLHIDITHLTEQINQLEPHKSRRILCFCRSGGRSQKAREILIAHGYELAVNVGGYEDLWRDWQRLSAMAEF